MANLICINGSPRRGSRTAVLIDAMATEICAKVPVERRDIAMASHGGAILSGLTREALSTEGDRLCRLVESADYLVVGSPVYRASYTGLLKHLFDLVDREALRGAAAVLLACGATPAHQLMLEHQLRPLMGFFGIKCAPTAVYAVEGDVLDDQHLSAAIAARIACAANELCDFVMPRETARPSSRAA